MGRESKGTGRSSKSSRNAKNAKTDSPQQILLAVDPDRIRFQHSRIRPYFSCGRSLIDTLEDIRNGQLRPDALPPIQVIVGTEETDDKLPVYFSLNNRRLWVLKRCREEGLLSNNNINVRVKTAKSDNETKRYTVDKCAIDAKLMREQAKKIPNTDNSTEFDPMPTHTHDDNIDSCLDYNDDDDTSVDDSSRSQRHISQRTKNPFVVDDDTSSSTDE